MGDCGCAHSPQDEREDGTFRASLPPLSSPQIWPGVRDSRKCGEQKLQGKKPARGMEMLEGLQGQEIYHSYLFRLANKSPLAEETDFEFYKTIYMFSSVFLSGIVPGHPFSGLRVFGREHL